MSEAAYDAYNCPTYYICPSCGTEFGYHDATKSFDEIRAVWLASGGLWSDANIAQPLDWSAYEQITKAGLKII